MLTIDKNMFDYYCINSTKPLQKHEENDETLYLYTPNDVASFCFFLSVNGKLKRKACYRVR